MKLLTTNSKLEKSNDGRFQFLTAGLAIAPHNIGGPNVCEQSTVGCRAACVLWFAGRSNTPTVRNAMTARKDFLFSDPIAFRLQLQRELDAHKRRADRKGATPVVRLNVASDLDWFDVARANPDIRFYDYTKVFGRLGTQPLNYDLTYSLSERSRPRDVVGWLRDGGNVAAVFSTRYHPQSGRIDPLPKRIDYCGHVVDVVDGDSHDLRLREIDGCGRIVGLRFKGSLKKRELAIARGFCLDADQLAVA